MKRQSGIIIFLSVISGIQVARFGAVRFFAMASAGEMSWIFALVAGIGDLIIAILTLPVIYALLFKRTAAARKWVVIWNMAGIIDLLLALLTGVLTDFPLQAKLESAIAEGLTMGFIPMVAVPACIFLHLIGIILLSGKKVRQLFI